MSTLTNMASANISEGTLKTEAGKQDFKCLLKKFEDGCGQNEKSKPNKSVIPKTNVKLSQDDICVRENQVNQMKVDLETVELREKGKQNPRALPKIRSATLTDIRSPSTYKRSPKRYPLTVPSDRDESTQILTAMGECLSKAIHWRLADLINAFDAQNQDLILPKWITKEERKQILDSSNERNKFRKFLCILKMKDFETMQGWLQERFDTDKDVLERIWLTFQECYDDTTKRNKKICFVCRVVRGVHVGCVIDYLYSGDIISESLCIKAGDTKLPVGSQNELWKAIIDRCKQHLESSRVVSALKLSLSEAFEKSTGNEKSQIEELLLAMNPYENKPEEMLKCHCHTSLHPLSCVKSMSLARIYNRSPPIQNSCRNTESYYGPHVRQYNSFGRNTESHSTKSSYARNIPGPSPSSSLDSDLNNMRHEKSSSTQYPVTTGQLGHTSENNTSMYPSSQTNNRKASRRRRRLRNQCVSKHNQREQEKSDEEPAKAGSCRDLLDNERETKTDISTLIDYFQENGNKTMKKNPQVIYAKTVNINSTFNRVNKTNRQYSSSDS